MPGDGSGPLISCMVRLPNGTRISRRFRQSDDASVLFHWVDSTLESSINPGSYRLIAQHPRRILEASEVSGGDMLAAGLMAGQEALFVERVEPMAD